MSQGLTQLCRCGSNIVVADEDETVETLLEQARAQLTIAIEEIDRFDRTQLPEVLVPMLAAARDRFVRLQLMLAADVVSAELEAMMLAGRMLTPAELDGLLLRH